MRHNLMAAWLAAFAVTGCSGSTTPSGEPDGGRRPIEPPPKTAVTSCSIKADVALGKGEGTSPAIAFEGDQFAVAWTDLTRGAGDIVLSLIDRDGGASTEHRIAGGAAAQFTPAVASMPGGFLVAWEEIGPGGGMVRAVRVGADGEPQGTPFTVATSVSPEAHPDAAPTRNGALLGWTEATGAYVAETDDGKLGPKVAIPGGQQVSVAGADDGGAAVWVAGERIGVMRIRVPVAQDAKAPTLFREAPGRANLPRIAAGPARGFGVVWEDARGGPNKESVLFAHVGPEGAVSREIPVSPAGGSANCPDVAWIGERAAVAYYQYRDGPPAIYLALVDPAAGVTGRELEISDRAGARFPRIVAGGGGVVGVAYSERGGPARIAVVECR